MPDIDEPYPIDVALALASAAEEQEVVAREIAAEHEALRVELLRVGRELEEERRHCAALREQVRLLEESDDGQVVILTAERDRLRNEFGEVCEDRDRLRKELRGIGRAVTDSGRRLRFDEAGA